MDTLFTRFVDFHSHVCAKHAGKLLVLCAILAVTARQVFNLHMATWVFGRASKRETALQGLEFGSAYYLVCILYLCYHVRHVLSSKGIPMVGKLHIIGVMLSAGVVVVVLYSCSVVYLLRLKLSAVMLTFPIVIILMDLKSLVGITQIILGNSSKSLMRRISQGLTQYGVNLLLDVMMAVSLLCLAKTTGVPSVQFIACAIFFGTMIQLFIALVVLPSALSLLREKLSRFESFGNFTQRPSWRWMALKTLVCLLLLSSWVYFKYVGTSKVTTKKSTVPGQKAESYDSVKFWKANLDDIVTVFLFFVVSVRYFSLQSVEDELNAKLFQSSEEMCSESTEKSSQKYAVCLEDVNTSNEGAEGPSLVYNAEESNCRPLEECQALLQTQNGAEQLTDDEVILLVKNKDIPFHQLENKLGNPLRGVCIRRKIVCSQDPKLEALDVLPYQNYDYSKVLGTCCENVIGYVPLPVGVAGPLLLDGTSYMVPLATTEGCLVASINRGCRALSQCGGVTSCIYGDGMTRGPVVRLPSAKKACDIKFWFDEEDNFLQIKEAFDSTSRFAKLQSVHCSIAGRLVFIRFCAVTGDAMGMNMVSKGTQECLKLLQAAFDDLEVISLSGNYCADKKASAVNWIAGRGKSVVCEAVIPGNIIKQVLKTSAPSLVELNTAKNLIGSSMAGSLGGFNAHAANIVSAVFIATGQDPAQTVTSSHCITLLEKTGQTDEDLFISCTMPCLEVGTMGGGTRLAAQQACLKMLSVAGSCERMPGANAALLASVICATVLAGELSLLSALATGRLVESHLRLNRPSSEQ